MTNGSKYVDQNTYVASSTERLHSARHAFFWTWDTSKHARCYQP